MSTETAMDKTREIFATSLRNIVDKYKMIAPDMYKIIVDCDADCVGNNVLLKCVLSNGDTNTLTLDVQTIIANIDYDLQDDVIEVQDIADIYCNNYVESLPRNIRFAREYHNKVNEGL